MHELLLHLRLLAVVPFSVTLVQLVFTFQMKTIICWGKMDSESRSMKTGVIWHHKTLTSTCEKYDVVPKTRN